MATRAVITIFDDVTFYKHNDGYPEGIAQLLYNAQEFGTGVNMPERMEEVEPALEELQGDVIPPDVEYQYRLEYNPTVYAGEGEVGMVTLIKNGSGQWVPVENVSVPTFFKLHLPQ